MPLNSCLKLYKKRKTQNILLPTRLHFLVQERLMYKTLTRQTYNFLNKNLFTFNLYSVCIMCVPAHACCGRAWKLADYLEFMFFFHFYVGFRDGISHQSLVPVSFFTGPSQQPISHSLATLTERELHIF